ncbi:31011_t:CDS:2, partial [Gigaspora margarita]
FQTEILQDNASQFSFPRPSMLSILTPRRCHPYNSSQLSSCDKTDKLSKCWNNHQSEPVTNIITPQVNTTNTGQTQAEDQDLQIDINDLLNPTNDETVNAEMAF